MTGKELHLTPDAASDTTASDLLIHSNSTHNSKTLGPVSRLSRSIAATVVP